MANQSTSPDGSKLVVTMELYEIGFESNFECVMSGHTIHFHPKNFNRISYWSLTLDYIDLLKYYSEIPRSWSENNLQPLSAVLNSVKGHVSNDELEIFLKENVDEEGNT